MYGITPFDFGTMVVGALGAWWFAHGVVYNLAEKYLGINVRCLPRRWN